MRRIGLFLELLMNRDIASCTYSSDRAAIWVGREQKLLEDHPYLSKVEIPPATAQHFGLGVILRGPAAGRIAIPIHDERGNRLGHAAWRKPSGPAVGGDATDYLLSGTPDRNGAVDMDAPSQLLYNVHRLEPDEPLVAVVQDCVSVWWLWQHGLHAAVALMGATTSTWQAVLLNEATDARSRILIFTDGDEAGDHAAAAVMYRLSLGRWCRRVDMTTGQQPTDFSGAQISEMVDMALGTCRR
jgi:hypothetical protein